MTSTWGGGGKYPNADILHVAEKAQVKKTFAWACFFEALKIQPITIEALHLFALPFSLCFLFNPFLQKYHFPLPGAGDRHIRNVLREKENKVYSAFLMQTCISELSFLHFWMLPIRATEDGREGGRDTLTLKISDPDGDSPVPNNVFELDLLMTEATTFLLHLIVGRNFVKPLDTTQN